MIYCDIEMRSCVTPEGLLGISAASLKDFDNEISQIPNDACAPFNAAASRLEAELKQAYRFVASIARESDDLDDIAQFWTAMTSFCDSYAERLSDLHSLHPMCGVGHYYDRVLDSRNTCKRLAALHA